MNVSRNAIKRWPPSGSAKRIRPLTRRRSGQRRRTFHTDAAMQRRPRGPHRKGTSATEDVCDSALQPRALETSRWLPGDQTHTPQGGGPKDA
eukprot:8009732-Pyramimonas_sp.AAC.1